MSVRAMTFAIAAFPIFAPFACREKEPSTPPPAVAPRAATADPVPVSPPPRRDQPITGSDPITPADTVRRVNELRRAGRMSELARYIDAEHRPAVLDLIAAVDKLLQDNRALQQRIAAAGAPASARLFDRSEAGNIIDVFSIDVEVIAEKVDGGSAVVTIQVGQRVPLSRVNLRLQGDRWVILTDPPIAGLAVEIRNLGQALRQVASAVETRDLTVEEIGKELEFWQRPVLARIEKLVADAKRRPTSESSDESETADDAP
ncbi:MAG: hypothetical protein GY778_18160 [bacterium]|nr:hypothetical protein [bacterium]